MNCTAACLNNWWNQCTNQTRHNVCIVQVSYTHDWPGVWWVNSLKHDMVNVPPHWPVQRKQVHKHHTWLVYHWIVIGAKVPFLDLTPHCLYPPPNPYRFTKYACFWVQYMQNWCPNISMPRIFLVVKEILQYLPTNQNIPFLFWWLV